MHGLQHCLLQPTGPLTAEERDQIDQAVATVRRHRTVMLPGALARGDAGDLRCAAAGLSVFGRGAAVAASWPLPWMPVRDA